MCSVYRGVLAQYLSEKEKCSLCTISAIGFCAFLIGPLVCSSFLECRKTLTFGINCHEPEKCIDSDCSDYYLAQRAGFFCSKFPFSAGGPFSRNWYQNHFLSYKCGYDENNNDNNNNNNNSNNNNSCKSWKLEQGWNEKPYSEVSWPSDNRVCNCTSYNTNNQFCDKWTCLFSANTDQRNKTIISSPFNSNCFCEKSSSSSQINGNYYCIKWKCQGDFNLNSFCKKESLNGKFCSEWNEDIDIPGFGFELNSCSCDSSTTTTTNSCSKWNCQSRFVFYHYSYFFWVSFGLLYLTYLPPYYCSYLIGLILFLLLVWAGGFVVIISFILLVIIFSLRIIIEKKYKKSRENGFNIRYLIGLEQPPVSHVQEISSPSVQIEIAMTLPTVTQ